MNDAQQVKSPPVANAGLESKTIRVVGGASLLLAALQSLCTAIVAVNGVRTALGLTALAAMSGFIAAPAAFWHQDAIRIPMLWLAIIGSLVNLSVIAWIRHLRGKSGAQWRRREPSTQQKRSERLQIFLAILTLALVAVETTLHVMRTGHSIF